MQDSKKIAIRAASHNLYRKYVPGLSCLSNFTFVKRSLTVLAVTIIVMWLINLLLASGDVHPNPGPSSSDTVSTDSSFTSSVSLMGSINLSKHLSFVHYNVQSLVTKLDLLYTELNEFDILAFTETWLNQSVLQEDIQLHSYCLPERKDRRGDSHGGVIIYVKDTLHYVRRNDLEINDVECLWIDVTLKHKHVLFGVFYRPPSSDAAYFSAMEDSISLAIDSGISDIIVTGDFNYNMLNPLLTSKIQDLCQQFSLKQTIAEPTHFTEHSSSLLDLILTNNENHLIISGVGDPFLQQDIRYHCPIFGILNFSKAKTKTYLRQTWSYEQGDYDLLRQMAASTNWVVLHDPDINIHALNISEHIQEIAKECIPNRTTRIRPSEPQWITTAIKLLIRKRKRAYRKAKRTNLTQHWRAFKKLRNTVTSEIRQSKEHCRNVIVNKLKSESLTSRDWWSTLKNIISGAHKASIPPLENDGTIFSDDLDKANILNNYFCDQTIIDDKDVELPLIYPYDVESNLSTITFTPADIESVLKVLPLGKATGPDSINNRVLRELATELSIPLCSLFNQSVQTGIFPECWKFANVCPIHKNGDRSVPSNYRPVSLLCTTDKVFERVIFKHLYNHFLDNKILTPLQSGFIPGDSTVNQLTYLYDTFCQALDSGKEVRVIFCDISKAFDRVWHKGLLLKLEAAGISGNLLLWFASYLDNRRQRVVLPGANSRWNSIHAGVPQGSVLGPLLFLLFINDIVNDIGSSIRLFADDTSLYIIVENPELAAQLLNTDLEKITKWAKTWLVTFNPSKTETLLISRKVSQQAHPDLFMLGQKITEVDTHKHLGIYFSNDCSWHKHITYIKEKAWNRINVMRKLKFELDRKSLEAIYLTFIRPILEYGDIIFDNCTNYEKQELEKIQTEAARIATGTTKLVSIETLYKEIGWDTLDTRRRKHKLTLFYKMYYSVSPPYLSLMVPPPVGQGSSYSLRNANDIQTVLARTSQYYSSFLPSVVREWNSLPSDSRNSDSVQSFKQNLNVAKISVPKYFYFGDRKSQVLHTRLRTKCSSLKHDLFLKRITDTPLCRCGSVENTQHFFMTCYLYRAQRNELFAAISQYCQVSMDTLLYGNNTLSNEINSNLFAAVHKYIHDTKRF